MRQKSFLKGLSAIEWFSDCSLTIDEFRQTLNELFEVFGRIGDDMKLEREGRVLFDYLDECGDHRELHLIRNLQRVLRLGFVVY